MGVDLPADWEDQFRQLSECTETIEVERPYRDLEIIELISKKVEAKTWLKTHKQFLFPKTGNGLRLHNEIRDLDLELSLRQGTIK